MASRRKYQSIQDLAGSAELIVPEAPTEDQSAMGKEIASEPKPASIPEPMPKPERERISMTTNPLWICKKSRRRSSSDRTTRIRVQRTRFAKNTYTEYEQ